jgi:regulator of sigma E protease
MEVLSITLQLLASLSFLILLHELGHFLAARYFGVRVIKFYLFFDFLFPFPNVANFSLFKKQVGDTEWGIGWFPFGGYVQMAGIMDESMDKEALQEPEKPDEFRAKPAWQRLIILLGGIFMNILVAFIIYSTIAFVWGDKYLPAENARYGIYADEIAREMGLENGDKIISIDGKVPNTFSAIPMMIILDGGKTIQVERAGEQLEVAVPDNLIKKLLDNKGLGFIDLAYPCMIGGFTENSNFEKAGGQVGDNVVALNGVPVRSFQEFVELKGDLRSTTVEIDVERNGELLALSVELDEDGKLGFFIPPITELFDLETKKYGVFAALVEGPRRTWSVFSGYFKQLKFLFNKENEGWKHVGSFGTFAKIFPKVFDLQMFLERTAFISVILAFMNLLPIPALDGGHAMFTSYEIIFRRKPNEKFMEYAQMAGMILLLGLMSLGIFNDIFR